MKNNFTFFFLLFACVVIASCGKRSGNARVLVFSKTSGYHHTSIAAGVAAIQKMGAENKFDVDTTTDAAMFNEDSLAKYAAVVFLSTTDTADVLLNHYQEAAFERYIQAGGGFVGVHAAADAEYHWGWYGRLIGGYFSSHPEQQEAVLNVVDKTHGATKHLPAQWKRKDEWYNYKNLSKDVTVLMTLDETSYKGGTNGANHPAAWYHEFDGGRAFYTALGHTDESYSEPAFLQHLLGGIQYAIGDNKKLDYSKAKTQLVPEEDRFVKTVLNQGNFFEPTEMAILPDLNVLIAQRRGEIMFYNDKTKAVKQAGFLNVYHQTSTPGVNAEEGIMGLTIDPDFKSNRFVYVFYSPVDTSVNRLSRFEFKDDTLDTKTEKVVLQFYSQREICCHTGGSLAFGKDNLLYLSTGDNTTPFDEPKQPFANHGFAPLDDRPGHEQYDARRSSGNSADLRGKVLRIKVAPDGSYTIPPGNLFSPNDPKTRPEIYTMGHRNPYRISTDKKTGFLYWGEVGPDSRVDSFNTRGPRGYDEVNQARKAGYFGWPFFVGNNYAYLNHDYTTGVNGAPFNAAQPMNVSRNNTGLQALPPAQPAFIYYPYDFSKDFPQVGSGGRNAMSGPVYYVEDFPKDTRYPSYFNGKLFIYEWMRNWIKLVQMRPGGDFDKMEAFMESTKWNSPIDMEVGPDGRVYVLEYGSGWFSKNADAGLSRIDFIGGNRPPKVDSLKVAKESGALPYTFTATVNAKDPEGDKLTYRWMIGKTVKETTEPRLQYTIDKVGEYDLSVEVVDDKKGSSKSGSVILNAGNEQPEVEIAMEGNKSFYFPGKPLNYSVKIGDGGAKIDTSNVFVTTAYIEGGEDLALQGHQVVPETIMGRNLTASMDCKSCHKVAEKSIGPPYMQVSQRYRKDPKASSFLIEKIIKGGAGNWGDVAMPAHPTLKEGDAKMMITWILSLGAEGSKSLPLAGKIIPQQGSGAKAITLTASYTDVGGAGLRPLTGSKVVYLRSSFMDLGRTRTGNAEGFDRKDSAGARYLVMPEGQGSLKLEGVDVTGLKGIELSGFGMGAPAGYDVELRRGSATGQKIGEGKIVTGAGKQKTSVLIPFQPGSSGKLENIFIYIKRQNGSSGNRPLLQTLRFVPV